MSRMNEIYIRRSNQMFVDKTKQETTEYPEHVATLIKNIEYFGYTFCSDIVDIISKYSVEELDSFYREMKGNLQVITGMSNRKYKPMYPDFPRQVMESSDAELYINAICHYFGDWVGLRIMPEYDEKVRLPLTDKKELKVIGLGNRKDFVKIFQNLMSANTSISDTDKGDIKWYLDPENNKGSFVVPDEMPNREVKTFVCGALNEFGHRTVIPDYLTTATDVLRFATAISHGDVSLASPTIYKKFKRSERKLILTCLETCKTIEEDMARYKNQWIRIGEIIHPGEYKTRFPKAYTAFQKLRENKHIAKFNTVVEDLLAKGEVAKVVKVLKDRPGEYARRLDHMLRLSDDKNRKLVVRTFTKLADKISTAVLMQVMTHYKHRRDNKELRIVFPKGNVSKVQAFKNNLKQIDKEVCESVVRTCSKQLMKIFSEKEKLGNVYIDEKLQNYLVPFSQRSASKSLKTLVRGSRIDLPEGDTVRFFTWWKDIAGETNDEDEFGCRVDLDLSAVMFDENWEYVSHLSYTNLKGGMGCHSGDITSAPEGACEYIDVNIPKSIKHRPGSRYIVMNLLSYTQQPFKDVPEASCGWMIRQDVESGEIFEPKTVEQKIDLTGESKICIPAIIDMYERQVIWGDISLSRHPNFNNNIEGNLSGIGLMGKALTEFKKTNLYDLFTLHAKARGKLVDTPEDADTIFSLEEGTTPYDIEEIVSNYL